MKYIAGELSRKPVDLGEVVICGGRPFTVLDNFYFDRSALRRDSIRNHPAQVDAIAAQIVRRKATSKPVASVCIVGHTDDVGSLAYNYELGLRRARAVKDALCRALGSNAVSLTFVMSSLGETEPAHTGSTTAARAGNRRVEVHLLSNRVNGEACTGGRKLPPDNARCGVPKPGPSRECEFGREFEERERKGAGVAVQPKLCLFLDSSNTSHRNHFQHQATGTANRIRAIRSPDAADCKKRIGPTPYSTGADIIAALRAAFQCTGKKPLQSVHIFGHSGSYGIFGAIAGTAGLYQNSYTLDAAARGAGGRIIADIPTDVLSDNVIFVLHGCNQAFGCNTKGDDDNFARSLLEHLAGALKAPKVFGHYNAGCAGRNNSWCQYSKTVPKGKAGSAPLYADPGGCKS